MSSTVFVRAALRPLASAPAAASSSFAMAARQMSTARPVAARAAAASKTALPKFSSASFLAATFRRSARRSGQSNAGSRRWQSTGAGADATAPHPSVFKRLWDSPVGIKTVHFWAPVLKWVLVLAGVSDFARPAEKLSVTQNLALTATGLIWTRWCLIIKPRNIMLAAVNFFLGIVGVIQCSRIFLYNQSVKAGKAETPAAEKQ